MMASAIEKVIKVAIMKCSCDVSPWVKLIRRCEMGFFYSIWSGLVKCWDLIKWGGNLDVIGMEFEEMILNLFYL